MTKEQITFLMSSGFSLDEIMQMQTPAQPDPQPAPQPVENSVETVDNLAPQPVPQPDPRLDPGQNSQLEQLIAQNQQLIQMIQMIQRNNINGIQFGNPQPERTVDDILAEIINPPSKNKEE